MDMVGECKEVMVVLLRDMVVLLRDMVVEE
jgi:hypothetical protein